MLNESITKAITTVIIIKITLTDGFAIIVVNQRSRLLPVRKFMK